MCGKRFKNVGIGLTMWEMASIFGKWLKYVGNGLVEWKTALA